MFPSDERTAQIRTKSKENAWVSAITAKFPELDWKHDKSIYVDFHGGCCDTKRRIDLRCLVEIGDRLVLLAIDIDENQHKGYPPDYESTRYNDLAMDFTGTMMFLRINPDPFWIGSERVDPSFENRVEAVSAYIHRVLGGRVGSDIVNVRHFFYDK
jgi:hypothetical protein